MKLSSFIRIGLLSRYSLARPSIQSLGTTLKSEDGKTAQITSPCPSASLKLHPTSLHRHHDHRQHTYKLSEASVRGWDSFRHESVRSDQDSEEIVDEGLGKVVVDTAHRRAREIYKG